MVFLRMRNTSVTLTKNKLEYQFILPTLYYFNGLVHLNKV